MRIRVKYMNSKYFVDVFEDDNFDFLISRIKQIYGKAVHTEFH